MKTRCELIPLAATVFASVIIAVAGLTHKRPDVIPRTSDINCVLDIKCLSESTSALVTGFAHHILSNFASSRNRNINISLAEDGASYRDSLISCSLDMVAAPFSRTLAEEGLVSSVPIDSLIIILTSPEKEHLTRDFNDWFKDWSMTGDYLSAKDMFLVNHSPFSNPGRGFISPYDSILKACADSTGTDWKLLAAIMYKESRFHMEAGSPRGAVGLMQVKPSTARYLDISDPVDPEQNILAGARYISRLEKLYKGKAANREELRKFTLAAYNAGEGRIDECLNYARIKGKDSSYWKEIVEVIPEMSDSSVVESGILKYGKFSGRETVYFVDTVIELYHNFCRICPD